MHLRKRTPTTTTCRMDELEPRRHLAGNFSYAIGFGSEEEVDQGNAIAADAAGNTYVAGTFRDLVDFDPTSRKRTIRSVADKEDAFVAKFSPTGRLLWVRTFGGKQEDAATDIAVGPGGELFVTGFVDGTVNFGTAKSPRVVRSKGDNDAFVVRLNPKSGATIWAGSIGGDRDDEITALAVGPDGDVYLSGYARLAGDLDPRENAVRNVASVGIDDQFIGRFDGATGRPKWVRTYGEADTREQVSGMAVASDGSVYVTGVFNRDVRFDRQRSTFNRKTAGGNDVYVGRLTANGAWDFVRTFGGRKGDDVVDLALGADDSIYLTGKLVDEADLDPSPSRVRNVEPLEEESIYVSKLSGKSAALIWAKQFDAGKDGAISVHALGVDPGGDVFVTGGVAEEADFNPGGGGGAVENDKDSDAGFLDGEIGATDAYVAKLDGADGDFLFVRTTEGEDGSASGLDIALDQAGDIYVTGGFSNELDFNPGAGRRILRTLEEDDDVDVFVWKLLA